MSSSESSLSTVSAHDLGKIIEEELEGVGNKRRDGEKIILVQTKSGKRRKKSRRGKGRRSANGKVWESKKTFTIRVEEMHQVDDANYNGVAGWRKNQVESPVVWNFIKEE